jgi:hypothetical protein
MTHSVVAVHGLRMAYGGVAVLEGIDLTVTACPDDPPADTRLVPAPR